MSDSFHTVQCRIPTIQKALELHSALFNKQYNGYSFVIDSDAVGTGNTALVTLSMKPENGQYDDLTAREAFNELMQAIGLTAEVVNPIFMSTDDLSNRLGFER